ncbi:MAG: neutral/alkaline non-lysosomal ceramidase N-terminal domain-containing protein [Terriglobia bacterium]
MLKVMRKLWIGCLLVVALPLSAAAGGLKAGTAKVEITPPLGLEMYGYADRKGGATSVLDPLMARVLVLETGEQRLALINMDLGEPLAPAWIARLREHALKQCGIPYVLVTATHTHSGPDIRDEYPSKDGPDWETGVLEKVEKALDDAHRNGVEAKLGTGYGHVLIGHNRLRREPDGTVTWFERNTTMVPTSPVDSTVSVLRVDGADGKPLAILVNYACHAVIFGSDHLRYSADYPGVMMKTVEQEFGGQAMAMFLQGGDGDINPYYAVQPLDQDAVKMRDWTGERLGREAARVAKGIETASTNEASLDVAEDLVDSSLRWNAEKFREATAKSWGPKAAEAVDRRLREGIHLPVATVLINKRIAIMTMPGEPFVEYQIDWRNRCPVRDAFFFGYTNGGFGYFPTIDAASWGGYGAGNTATWVSPDAGARMVNHAIIKVYEMLGRLSDTPEDLK